MAITSISSFLVNPGKNLENPQDSVGAILPLKGNLFNMLQGIYLGADNECDIPIRFVMDAEGNQNNEIRSNIIEYIGNPGINAGQILANHLRDCTTNKSGLGLLFIILGEENDRSKIVISRFPADTGILAETRDGGLRVDYIERVFMKNASSYKAAIYIGTGVDGNLWDGHTTDRQVNSINQQIAYYWIREFLSSDFLTTPKAGTQRIALAVRGASAKSQDSGVKHELVSFARLIQNLNGQMVSLNDLIERFNLSEEAAKELLNHIPNVELATDQFQFDADEFRKHASFSSVELNTGAILVGPSDQFDDIFTRDKVKSDENVYRFSTEGQIVDERVKGRK